MKIVLPQHVQHIIYTLNSAGYGAYAVGGCVRDSLRGKIPADWDIATAAPPDIILTLFPKTIPTGLPHGTVTVLMDGIAYEVTTLRVDGVYEDHRRPEQVTFTDDITEDLSRRDFTMNAMAYHPDLGLIDPFGGRQDIEQKLIRCVGDPLLRFDEDALRMMRAVRFAAQTGFTIHQDILGAIERCASLITAVSAERIRDELMKILLSPRPEQVELLHETGLLVFIMPELDRCFFVEQNTRYHCYDVGHHIMVVLHHVPNSPVLRLAALLHDVGKPDRKTTDTEGVDHFRGHEISSAALADVILTRLRVDNNTKTKVIHLIRFHDRRMEETKVSVRRSVAAVGTEQFLDLLSLMRADTKGHHPEHIDNNLRHYDKLEDLYHEIIADDDALKIADLAINGHDVLDLGYQGKKIGTILNYVLEFVLEHPEQNEKSLLLMVVQNNFLK
ncbi:MAG: HD domain-containing protein [Ruminococcaceae bacterium]|nr:HD domain-containing protein [Oscillospiraceae bacterium]